MNRFENLFSGEPDDTPIKKVEAGLVFKKGPITPKFHKARAVPFSMEEAVGETIDQLEKK